MHIDMTRSRVTWPIVIICDMTYCNHTWHDSLWSSNCIHVWHYCRWLLQKSATHTRWHDMFTCDTTVLDSFENLQPIHSDMTRSRVPWLIVIICAMTRSSVQRLMTLPTPLNIRNWYIVTRFLHAWHDSLFIIRDVTRSLVKQLRTVLNPFEYQRLMRCDVTSSCVTWLIYVRNDSLRTCVAWLMTVRTPSKSLLPEYSLFYRALLRKRLMILRSLLIVATQTSKWYTVT